eukprot:scaffold12300_cov132-Isochrysis_galbana.AAC.5
MSLLAKARALSRELGLADDLPAAAAAAVPWPQPARWRWAWVWSVVRRSRCLSSPSPRHSGGGLQLCVYACAGGSPFQKNEGTIS